MWACVKRTSRIVGHTLISHAGLLLWRSPFIPNALIHPLSDSILCGESLRVTYCTVILVIESLVACTACYALFSGACFFLSVFPRGSQIFSVPGPWFLRATLVPLYLRICADYAAELKTHLIAWQYTVCEQSFHHSL